MVWGRKWKSNKSRSVSRKARGFWGAVFLILLGALAYHFSPLITGSVPEPHKAQGPFPVGVVRVAPMPAHEAMSAGLDGVLVCLEGPLEEERKTRSGTLLLWVDGFKVVAYPFLARDLARGMRPGLRVKVVGVLRNHPRYGWEVILRRPSDLEPVRPSF